jgi:hypothetical protein
MTANPRKTRVLGRYVERSIALGLGLLIPATGLLVAAAFAEGTAGVILSNLGSAVGTVAILSLLYDPFLRDILAAEIFEKLQLRDSVIRAGLVDIGEAHDFSASDAFRVSPSADILPLDPIDWAQREYTAILRAARDHAIAVRVFLPSPDPGPALIVLADRLGIGDEEMTRQLRLLPDELVAAWDRSACHRDSTLTVLQFEGIPAVGLLVHAGAVVYDIGPSLGFDPTEHRSTRLAHVAGSPAAEWAAGQLRFSGRADPVVAGLRPVTRPTDLPSGRGPSELTDDAHRPATSQIDNPPDDEKEQNGGA